MPAISVPPAAVFISRVIPPLRTHHLLVPPYNLSTKVPEALVNVRATPGAGLVIRRIPPGLRDIKGTGAGDGTVFFEVALVADKHYGYRRVIFDADNLVAQLGEFVEGGKGSDAEYEEEALAGLHVEFSHGGKLFRSSGVENFQHDLSTIHFESLAVRIFYRRIIAFYPDVLHKLRRKTTLADSA